MSYKRISPEPVVEGGTGAQTLTGILTGNGTSAITANTVTPNGVLYGGASNAAASTAVGVTGTVLIGTSASAPSYSATPQVTSVTFDGTNFLSSFVDWAPFTPTLDGVVSGTTTYNIQVGSAMRIGNMAIINFTVQISAATGTGNMTVAGFPFTINNTANYNPIGSCVVSGSASVPWPAGTTSVALQGAPGATRATFVASGSAVASSPIQIANTTLTVRGTLTYRI